MLLILVFIAYPFSLGVWLALGGQGRVETRVAQVWIWASGKLEWVKAYSDPDEARAAAERLAQERA